MQRKNTVPTMQYEYTRTLYQKFIQSHHHTHLLKRGKTNGDIKAHISEMEHQSHLLASSLSIY